jgi:hypothetical protein
MTPEAYQQRLAKIKKRANDASLGYDKYDGSVYGTDVLWLLARLATAERELETWMDAACKHEAELLIAHRHLDRWEKATRLSLDAAEKLADA